MLDSKKIIQLGLGVAIGMIAWHFIQQQMNKSALGGETASARGRKRSRSLSGGSTVNKSAPCRMVRCSPPIGSWTGEAWCCKKNEGKCCAAVPEHYYENN